MRILPEDVNSILDDPRLSAASAVHRDLASIYFDTPDLGLHGHGFHLCTRQQDGGSRVQVFFDKRRARLKESEIIQEIAGQEVDRSKLPAHGKVGAQLLAILADQVLQPVFELALRRSVWRSSSASGTPATELTLDEGEIRANGRAEPVHELRLSLAPAEVAEFYDWLLCLAEKRPLIWENLDLGDRGYELVCPTPVTHHKASVITLDKFGSSEGAYVTILDACLAQLQANLAATLAGEIEGVHQMRVALRRLRSCLKLFRPLIPKEISADVNAELRWLNGFFGPARDWDVFLEEGMAPLFARFPARPRLLTLRDQAERIRQAHRRALYRCLAEPRYHRLILRLHGWLACREWREKLSEVQLETLDRPVSEFATPLLARDHRRVVKVGKGFSRLTVAERHALRIRIKRLRYALGFFASLYRANKAAAYINATASLQDCLGGLNDVTVAERLLDEAKLARSSPSRHLIEGWYACKLFQHEQQFKQSWKQFRVCKLPWKSDRR